MRSKNANQFIAQLAQANPQVRSVLNMIQSTGNPQAIFKNMAKQMGADPQEVLNKLLN